MASLLNPQLNMTYWRPKVTSTTVLLKRAVVTMSSSSSPVQVSSLTSSSKTNGFPIMVNGCTGKMGKAIIKAADSAGLPLLPVSFGAAEESGHTVEVCGKEILVHGPAEREDVLTSLFEQNPNLIVIDFTVPAAVNDNAELYCKVGVPFVMGTTGGDRDKLYKTVEASNVYALISPQMGKQVVAFLAAMEIMAEQFPGAFAGYSLQVSESHQSSKLDTSGTAKAVISCFKKLGVSYDMDKIQMIRDPKQQLEMVGVPEEHLSGHAFHMYHLTSPDETVSFEFQHNVCGRSIYAEGTIDAALFLSKKIHAKADKHIYNMIDVLREDMADSKNVESLAQSSGSKHGGGWITFPFIAATLACIMLSGWGWLTNLIVYLIEEFNVKSISSAQISNVVSGCINLIPILGAIVADSYLGSFVVIVISCCFSLLGVVLLTLTASIKSLRPPVCEAGSLLCQSATRPQFAFLYASLALAIIGFGGTRFTLATLGANQHEKPKDQSIFFNWFFFFFYFACVVSSTVIVYLETSVSWGLGFGLCAAADFVGLVVFLAGNRFYIHDKPRLSPFGDLARVCVAGVRKWNIKLSSNTQDYYHGDCRISNSTVEAPSSSFRFLNRAALRTEGDTRTDGSIAKPWRICSVQQVEDFKRLMRIFPLWSSTLFLSTPIAIQQSMTVLQALAMDRRLAHSFKIPAGSVVVIVLITTSIFLAILDRFLFPGWEKLTGRLITPLQRIGAGHIFNIISMAISALVEFKRLQIAPPMSVCWLFPQLVIVGVGEAFHFPGQVSLYYQEFPASLKSTATAMVAGMIGLCYYNSTAIVGLIRNVTSWLPDDINQGRLDCVYWTVVVIGVVNFCYFLLCAVLYKYQNVEKAADRKETKAVDQLTVVKL